MVFDAYNCIFKQCTPYTLGIVELCSATDHRIVVEFINLVVTDRNLEKIIEGQNAC